MYGRLTVLEDVVLVWVGPSWETSVVGEGRPLPSRGRSESQTPSPRVSGAELDYGLQSGVPGGRLRFRSQPRPWGT